jgi:AraC-like DNA-binding protein
MKKYADKSAFTAALDNVITENNRLGDLTSPKIAALMGQTERTLHRQCKQHTGWTVIQYLQRYRIELAKELILKGADSVSIAKEVGYNCASAYLHAFKRETGLSPTRYIGKSIPTDRRLIVKRVTAILGTEIDLDSDKHVKTSLREELNILLPQRPTLEESLSLTVSDHEIIELLKNYRDAV